MFHTAVNAGYFLAMCCYLCLLNVNFILTVTQAVYRTASDEGKYGAYDY